MLLTIDQTAAFLQCSRSTVRTMWRDGLLPKPIRIGRRGIRWRAEELEQFINARRGVDAPEKELA